MDAILFIPLSLTNQQYGISVSGAEFFGCIFLIHAVSGR